MEALTPLGRFFGPLGHERRSDPEGSPCLSRTHVQPFCLQPPAAPATSFVLFTLPSVRGRTPENLASGWRPKDAVLLGSWRELRTALAGSLVGKAESSSLCVMSFMSRHYGRVVHLRQLSTPCCHDAVAFGYRRVNIPPDGDSHPAVCAPSQAHERRRPRRRGRRRSQYGLSHGPLCKHPRREGMGCSQALNGPRMKPRR